MSGFNTTCKYCGRGLLKWLQINGKWRMVDDFKTVHFCEALRKAKIEESKLKKAYS